LKVSSD